MFKLIIRATLFSILTLVLVGAPWSTDAQPQPKPKLPKLCSTKSATNDTYETTTAHAPGKALCTTLTVVANPQSEYSATASANFPQHTGSLAELSKCTSSRLNYRFRGWKNGNWNKFDEKPVQAKPTFDKPLPYATKIIGCTAGTGTAKRIGFDKYEVHISSQDGDNNRTNILSSGIRRHGPL